VQKIWTLLAVFGMALASNGVLRIYGYSNSNLEFLLSLIMGVVIIITKRFLANKLLSHKKENCDFSCEYNIKLFSLFITSVLVWLSVLMYIF